MHIHSVHPRAGKPLSVRDIQEHVKVSLTRSPTNELPVEHIWKEDIDIACGGSLKALLDALVQRPLDESEPEWQITEAGADMGRWLILWKNWTPTAYKEMHDLWRSQDDTGREEIEGNINGALDEDSQDWWSEAYIQRPMAGEQSQQWDFESQNESNWDNAGWPSEQSVDASSNHAVV